MGALGSHECLQLLPVRLIELWSKVWIPVGPRCHRTQLNRGFTDGMHDVRSQEPRATKPRAVTPDDCIRPSALCKHRSVSGDVPENPTSETDPGGGRESMRAIVDPTNPDPATLSRAGAMIRSGHLVAFPTETVYGLGAHALDESATAAVFRSKGRPSTDPLIVHVRDVDATRDLVENWDGRADELAQEFWPGPLTLVIRKSAAVPDSITAGRRTVALRIPANPVALGLLSAAGVPIAAPSANRFGRISPTRADDVEAELSGGYDLLLDGGHTEVGVESTVVDLSDEIPVLLRPGAVTHQQLQDLLGEVRLPQDRVRPEDRAAIAPGQFLRHYSPSTSLIAIGEAHGSGEAAMEQVLQLLDGRGITAKGVRLPRQAADAAKVLYESLRSADGSGDVLVVQMLEGEGLAAAVNDRIFRACQGRVLRDIDPEALEQLIGSDDLARPTDSEMPPTIRLRVPEARNSWES